MADMKGAGMLSDVSLRGVNFRFWSGLWCSGQITIIFSGKGLFQGCSERNITKLYIFNLFYLLDSCNQSLKWSLLGVKKGWPTPRLVSFGGLIQNFRQASPPGNKRERTGKERKGKEKEEGLLLSVHVQTLQANNNYSASGSEGRQVYDL